MTARTGLPEEAGRIFRDTLDWLRATYRQHGFFTERDLVWTVQKRLVQEVARRLPGHRVFHDYRMTNGEARSDRADLVVLDQAGRAVLAVEFKYEPDHRREGTEFPASKFPVVDWNAVRRDIDRIRSYRSGGFAPRAVSVFIDEGGAFRGRPAPPHGRWGDWDVGRDVPVAVLLSETPGFPAR